MASFKTPDMDALSKAAMIAARKGWVNVPQAAVMLGLHPQTVHLYITRGWIQARMFGKRRGIFLSEIDRYKREGNYSGQSDSTSEHSKVEEGEQSLSSSDIHFHVPDYDYE